MSEESSKNGLSIARAALAAARDAAKSRRVIKKRRAERPTRSSRDPQKFGAAILDLIQDRGWREEVAVGAVVGNWEKLVGSNVAAHVQPTEFTNGTLVLSADSTAWATQVRLLVPNLLRALAEEVGDGVIRSIEVFGPAAPSWKKGPRSAPGRGPRDTYG